MTAVNRDSSPRPSRRERAVATRRRIAEAAYDRFATQGYAATTMEAIAADAGVAIQTVYFTFHTKAELLVAAMVLAGGGAGQPEAVMERDWIRQVLEATDGPRRLALLVEHGNEIYRRLAPMFPAVSAAASVDPEVDRAWRQMVATRRDGMARVVGLMAQRGELNPGLDSAFATDVLFGLHRSEVYLAFTVECGWMVEEFKAWQYLTLAWQLLPATDANAALASGSPATADLSFARALERLSPLTHRPSRPQGELL